MLNSVVVLLTVPSSGDQWKCHDYYLCCQSLCTFLTRRQQSARRGPATTRRPRSSERRSQVDSGWREQTFGGLGRVLQFDMYSFPQVRPALGQWGSLESKDDLRDESKEALRDFPLVCCRHVNLHGSIQPCLHSLVLVIYSQAEQGCAFETAPGEQMKGKGSSSRKTNKHTYLPCTHTH